MPTLMGPDPSAVQSPLGHTVIPQAVPVAQQKMQHSDRIEVSGYYSLFVFNCMFGMLSKQNRI